MPILYPKLTKNISKIVSKVTNIFKKISKNLKNYVDFYYNIFKFKFLNANTTFKVNKLNFYCRL